jgi:hypothetical protein
MPLRPITPAGIQCPNAPVQSIAVPIRNCCGEVVGYTNRAPKPGDKEFVQCRCAEKQTAKQKLISGPRFEPFPATTPQLAESTILPEAAPAGGYDPHYDSVDTSPSVRPPVPA